MITPSLLTGELDDLRRMVANFETVNTSYNKAKTLHKKLQDSEQALASQGKELDGKIVEADKELPSQQSQQKDLLEQEKQLEQQLEDSKLTQPQRSELNNQKQVKVQKLGAVNKEIEAHAALRQSRSQIEQKVTETRAKIASETAQLEELTPQLELAKRNKEAAMRSVLDAAKAEAEKVLQHQDALTKHVWLGMLQGVLKDNDISPEKFREFSNQKIARELVDMFSQRITEVETALTPEELSDLDSFRKLPPGLSELENLISQAKKDLKEELGEKEELERELTNLSQKKPLSLAWKQGLDIAKWLAVASSIGASIIYFILKNDAFGIVIVLSLIATLILFSLRWYWDIEARQADTNASIQTHKEQISTAETSLNNLESESISSKQKLSDVLARHPDLQAFLTGS